MEAKTLQVRRTIRIPWMMLVVTALLVAVMAIGIGAITSRSDTTRVPATVHSIGPKDLSGPTAYPGFVPRGRVPDKTAKPVTVPTENGIAQGVAGPRTAYGKPFS